MTVRAMAALAAAVLAAGAARAEVFGAWDGGFTSKNVATVKGSPAEVFRKLGEIGRWWSDDHTYSGKAANMTMPLKAGGCFCEVTPGGSVAHGTVVLALPERGLLRVNAALGPLQELAATGALTWTLKAKPGGMTEVTQSYAVTGLQPAFVKVAGPGVDGVMHEALARFGRYVETGRP
jgi:hypothetical protein